MSPSLIHVNPGDRITADFMNALVDEIVSLQAQVDALGQTVPVGSAPVIAALSPADQVAVGDELDVIGLNFAVPASLNTVMLDGQAVTGLLPGSSATLLKLVVPALNGLPKDAQLRVSTVNGSASRNVHVVPPVVIPQGKPTISNVSGSLGTINAGSQYTFSFAVDATSVSTSESYIVAASWANAQPAAVPASAWSNTTRLIGVPSGPLTIDPHTPVTIGVQVVVPTGAVSADLQLTVTSVHNDPGTTAIPLTIPVTVGQAQQSDGRIKVLGFGQIGPAAPFKLADDGGIAVKYPAAAGGSTLAQIPINLNLAEAGKYHFAPTIVNNDPTLWTLGSVTPNDAQLDAGNTQVHLAVTLLATGPQNEQRSVNLVITRSDGNPPYSNFMQFSIRGFHP
jgi:hypothetical protein